MSQQIYAPPPVSLSLSHHFEVRVQPNNVEKFWLGGLVPNEIYAFRLTRWCDVTGHSAVSAMHYATIHVRSDSALGEAALQGSLGSNGPMSNLQFANGGFPLLSLSLSFFSMMHTYYANSY